MGIFFTGLSFLNRYFFALWQKTGNNGKTTGRKNAGILYQFPRLLFFHVSGVPAYTHALTLAIFLPITTGKNKKIPVAFFTSCHFFSFQTGIFLPTRIELPNWDRELPVFTGKFTGKRKY